ncbi:MAG TPA: poly(A) polymerase [Chlamydiales bacterium]|nr:poly(A) polymerase [Chlamydiales bacterium]
MSSYITLHAIQRVIPPATMPGFRLAYRALKTHCLSEGIYSNKFGYLSGIHLVLLLTRIAVLSPAGSSAQHLLRAFFATYASWDWVNQIVTIPGLNDEAATRYARQQAREPMVILSVHKPTFNKVHYANKHTLAAISASFKRTHERLARGEAWISVANTGGLYGAALKRFLDQSGFFVKVDVAFWCSSSIKARAWVGFVQSRLQHVSRKFSLGQADS